MLLNYLLLYVLACPIIKEHLRRGALICPFVHTEEQPFPLLCCADSVLGLELHSYGVTTRLIDSAAVGEQLIKVGNGVQTLLVALGVNCVP